MLSELLGEVGTGCPNSRLQRPWRDWNLTTLGGADVGQVRAQMKEEKLREEFKLSESGGYDDAISRQYSQNYSSISLADLAVYKGASPRGLEESRRLESRTQDWILKCLQGGRAHLSRPVRWRFTDEALPESFLLRACSG